MKQRKARAAAGETACGSPSGDRAALRERVKELECLYALSRVMRDGEARLDEVLEGAVEIIPRGFQYPELAGARVRHEGLSFQSELFCESPHRMAAAIPPDGCVEVSYPGEIAQRDPSPFLHEEKRLIEKIAAEISLAAVRISSAAEKARLEAQLRHADRLATIGVLATGIAHELNEPLASILGFAQLAEKTPGLPAADCSRSRPDCRGLPEGARDRPETPGVRPQSARRARELRPQQDRRGRPSLPGVPCRKGRHRDHSRAHAAAAPAPRELHPGQPGPGQSRRERHPGDARGGTRHGRDVPVGGLPPHHGERPGHRHEPRHRGEDFRPVLHDKRARGAGLGYRLSMASSPPSAGTSLSRARWARARDSMCVFPSVPGRPPHVRTGRRRPARSYHDAEKRTGSRPHRR